AMAKAFAHEGADIMLNGLGKPDEIEQIRSSLAAETGRKVLFSPADMTKPAEIAALVKAAEEGLGKIDILVHSAGIQHVSPVEDFPIETFDA
ncbi:SDR family NAD(P)-dependent oxidoreductase, partial [Stenotrophomonas maltophilia]|uniref:SDR family NAD(P)-dependent oxidoreductase n=1 Tax=Stenotrophomonas maltophilia TaxID=40324 RepID=UPI0013DA8DC0